MGRLVLIAVRGSDESEGREAMRIPALPLRSAVRAAVITCNGSKIKTARRDSQCERIELSPTGGEGIELRRLASRLI